MYVVAVGDADGSAKNDRAEVWVQASLNTIVHDQIAGESMTSVWI